MTAGRPTSYSDEILEKSREYLATYTEAIPSVAGLAVHLNLARSTVYAWADDENKKDFSDIVEGLLALQEIKLADGGLKGDYNPTIAKLMLAKHGYHDKQVHAGDPDNPIEHNIMVHFTGDFPEEDED